MTLRQALVTYDPDRFLNASSAEDSPLSWIFQRALSFQEYPRERGIHSIRHIPEGNEMLVVPMDGTEILMSFNPCITLPLDLVERLLEVAERGAGTGGSDRSAILSVRQEVAGTRERFDEVRIVAVPRMSRAELVEVDKKRKAEVG